MARKTISPGGSVSGVVELPGDKSISHRYAILAALAEGVSEIRNYSPAADCASTLECVRRLGIAVDAKGEHVRIAGKGLEGLKAPRRIIDAENSGSTIRMMSGVLAGQNFTSTITGDSSLRRRPMRRAVEPLRQMGADIRSSDGDRAPLEIRGGKLQAIDYTPPVPSAQVKSAILLAGSHGSGAARIRGQCHGSQGRSAHRAATEIAAATIDCAGGSVVRGISDRRGAGAAGIVADAAQRGAESHAFARAGFSDFDWSGDQSGVGAIARWRIDWRRFGAARDAGGWQYFRRAGGGND